MATKPKAEGVAAVRMEPRTSTVSGWNPDRIRQAEIRCASGDYSLAAELCEAMFADDRISKCINRLYAALSLPLSFLLPGKDAKQSNDDPICQALETDWWKILPEQQQKTLVQWLGLLWVCWGHIDGWRRDEETGRVLPVVSVWSVRHLRRNESGNWIGRVAASAADFSSTEERIEPGDGNWFLIVAGASYRSPYHAPWRGVARWWLLKQYAQVDWAASSERHGQGILSVTNTMTGTEMADTGETFTKAERKTLAQEVAQMGRNGVMAMPRGWVPELITDGANTFQTFTKQVDYANSAIDMALCGTNLTTEVTGGSYAAASVHQTVDAMTMRGLLELIATGAREQLLTHWAAFNFVGGVAPYPSWDTTPPEDKKATAEARKADAEALDKYVTAGAQIDQLAWFNEGKVQLVKGATSELKKPAVAPTATTKGFAAQAYAAAQAPETAFARGREYTDKLERSCCGHMAKELAPTLAAVLSAIEDGESYEDVENRLRQAYQDELPPSKLLKLTEAALIMGQLAGRETVEQELKTEE